MCPGIVFNPSEPDLINARTDIGGAYRWNPSTRRWIALLDWVGHDDWNLTGVDSLATDPVDPDRLYVLAGTYTNAWTSQNGAILRSTDRGETFERIDLPFKSGGNMPGRNMGERLAIDPNRNSTAITYQFSLAAGQTLPPGSNRAFAAQTSGSGTAHPTGGDSYAVTYTAGGQVFTQSGTF